MSYIGNTPVENYASFLTETFTVSATTNYTLSHAVTNENDIRLVINGVVQQPGSGKAYTASGTTLTLSSATASGDSMYAVYLGRALQTVNPPNASVGNSQTAPTIITGQTAETSIATDDTILIHDTSASALRKMTRANFVSGVGGTNTPSFLAYKSSDQGSISANTATKITYTTELYDTDNTFASSRFTPGVVGKYYVFAFIYLASTADGNNPEILFYKNGGAVSTEFQVPGATKNIPFSSSTMVELDADDYIEVYARTGTSSATAYSSGTQMRFGGFKIIT